MRADIGYWILTNNEKKRLASKRSEVLIQLGAHKGFAVLFSGEEETLDLKQKRFTPQAWFRDLTGSTEPGSAILLDGKTGEVFLFTSEKKDAERKIAKLKNKKGSLSSGYDYAPYQLGLDRTLEAFGLEGKDHSELHEAIMTRLGEGQALFVDQASSCAQTDQLVEQVLRHRKEKHQSFPSVISVGDFNALCVSLRLIKDHREQERLRAAAKITALGHLSAWEGMYRTLAVEKARGARSKPKAHVPDWQKASIMGPLGVGVVASGLESVLTERTLEATFMAAILNFGADGTAYAPSVAASENVLYEQWQENRRGMIESDWVVCDFGVKYQGFSSKIVRTLPCSGEFTGLRAELYKVVLEAQKKALESCIEGVEVNEVVRSVRRELIQSLGRLGILAPLAKHIPLAFEGDLESVLDKIVLELSPILIGRDLPDLSFVTENEEEELGEPLKWKSGMSAVIRIGIAFRDDLEGLTPEQEELRGFGVRLEDMILVTRDQPEVISALCPKEIEDLQSIAKACQKVPVVPVKASQEPQ